MTIPSKNKFLIWFHRLWRLASIILFTITMAAMYANRFSPAAYPMASLLALTLIPLTLVNIIWLMFSVMLRNYTVWLPVIALLFCSTMYGGIFWQPGNQLTHQPTDGQATIKVTTFNAGHFYNRSIYSKRYTDREANQAALQSKEWLAAQQSDIICIQEFFDDPQSDIFNVRQNIARNLPYVAFPKPEERHEGLIFFGLVVFSKYPIVNQGVIMTDATRNTAIFADVRMGADTLRIINAHLTSNHFLAHDFTRWHFRRYFDRAIERAIQTDSLARFISHSPYPTICCSDLNEIGLSYAYRKLVGTGLTDAFREAGSGWGSTFRYGRWLAPIRIDYVLANKRLKPVYYRTHPPFVPHEHNPVEVYTISQPLEAKQGLFKVAETQPRYAVNYRNISRKNGNTA